MTSVNSAAESSPEMMGKEISCDSSTANTVPSSAASPCSASLPVDVRKENIVNTANDAPPSSSSTSESSEDTKKRPLSLPSNSSLNSIDTMDGTPNSQSDTLPVQKKQKNCEIEGENNYNKNGVHEEEQKMEEKKMNGVEREGKNSNESDAVRSKMEGRRENKEEKKGKKKEENEEIKIETEEDRQRELEKIVKQIEYYFCDENIRYDSFFQLKMQEAHLEGQEEGWLEMRWIKSAPRIARYNDIFSEEEIIKNIEEKSSFLRTKKDDKKADVYWVSRNTKIPPLEFKNKNKNKNFNKNEKYKNKDYHIAGCLVKVYDIPEEVTSWHDIKETIKRLLPDSPRVLLRFVSKIKQDGVCYLWCKPFENDRTFFKKLEFEVNGAKVKTGLLENEAEIKRFLNEELTTQARHEREKDILRIRNKMQRENSTQKIALGEQVFNNIEHLRRCVRELLDVTSVDTVFKPNSNAANVLRSLLEYHPRRDAKLGVRGAQDSEIKFKVGFHEKKDKAGENVKCFFIIKKNQDGIETEEDFSVIKCINELVKNPPFVKEEATQIQQKENKNKEEDTSTQNEGGTEETKIAEEEKEQNEKQNASEN